MKNINVRVDEYADRVLDVFRAARGLNNKSEAFNELVHEFGPKILEPELNEEFAKTVLAETQAWEKKHGSRRKMTLDELEKP
ncbi:DUF2683 family protein [Candidatus Micrarchaeota archaeon]|nr:DUF2683 family protein [Candidatus Micrarchaeota archaeon]